MNCTRVLLGVITVLGVAANARAGDNSDYRFVIRPNLCVMEAQQQSCPAPLQAQWQHPLTQPRALCLFEAQTPNALYCDDATTSRGEHRWQALLTQDTVYVLKAQDEAATLAQASVNVAHLVTDLRPRRRYGWSIF